MFLISKIKRLFLITTFFTLSSMGTWAGTTEDNAIILALLKPFSEISIPFTYAPGMGHFAATKLLMNQIRSAGYTGTFQIYIDPECRNSMPNLLPGYNPSGDETQNLSTLNAVTHPLDTKDKYQWFSWRTAISPDKAALLDLPEIKRLAIIGGDDSSIPPEAVHADALLVIQPTAWYLTPEVRVRSLDSHQFYAIEYPVVRKAGIPQIFAPPTDPISFIRNAFDTPTLEEQTGQIKGFTSLIEKKSRYEVLTAYGLQSIESVQGSATLAMALMMIQDARKSVLKKGIVIPILSPLDQKQWKVIQSSLAEYTDRIHFALITDNDLADQLEKLGEKELLFLNVGSVPQEVWNYLMSISTLPAMAEGNTAMNFLSLFKKPIISTSGVSRGLSPDAAKYLRETADAFQRKKPQELAKYLTQALTPHSPLCQTFEANTEFVINKKDKLSQLITLAEPFLTCNLLLKKALIPNEPQNNSDILRYLKTISQSFRRI